MGRVMRGTTVWTARNRLSLIKMVSSTKPDEGHVLFWITEEDGREFATCAAASFRAAMTERDELRVQNKVLQLRGDTYLEQLQQQHAEIERLRAAINDLLALIKNVDAEANNVQLDIARALRRHHMDA